MFVAPTCPECGRQTYWITYDPKTRKSLWACDSRLGCESPVIAILVDDLDALEQRAVTKQERRRGQINRAMRRYRQRRTRVLS